MSNDNQPSQAKKRRLNTTDNPVAILAIVNGVVKGGGGQAFACYLFYAIALIIATYFLGADGRGLLPAIMLAAVAATMLAASVISVVAQHNPIAHSKRDNVYDQLIMTGLSPGRWIVGALLAAGLDFFVIVVAMTPLLVLNCLLFGLTPSAAVLTVLVVLVFHVNFTLITLLPSRIMDSMCAVSLSLFSILIFLPMALAASAEPFTPWLNVLFGFSPVTSLAVLIDPPWPEYRSLLQDPCLIFGVEMRFVTAYFIEQLTAMAVFLAYLIVGMPVNQDERAPFKMNYTRPGTFNIDLTLMEKKDESLKRSVIDDCRHFQENNGPSIVRHARGLRLALDLVVTFLLLSFLLSSLREPVTEDSSPVFAFLLLAILYCPISSFCLNVCEATVTCGRTRRFIAEIVFCLLKAAGIMGATLLVLTWFEDGRYVEFEALGRSLKFLVVVDLAVLACVGAGFALGSKDASAAARRCWAFLFGWIVLIPSVVFIARMFFSYRSKTLEFTSLMSPSSCLSWLGQRLSDMEGVDAALRAHLTWGVIIAGAVVGWGIVRFAHRKITGRTRSHAD